MLQACSRLKCHPPTSTKAVFVGINTTRSGTWKGAVGTEGYKVIANSQSLPSYATMAFTGGSDWIWQYQTSDTRALQNHVASRIASCHYATSSFEVDLNIKDGKSHNVSFYCLDWDGMKRTQKVEVLDYDTKQVIHSYNLSNFSNGAYLTYAVDGHVIVRFTNTGPGNAVLSGVFFDPSSI